MTRKPADVFSELGCEAVADSDCQRWVHPASGNRFVFIPGGKECLSGEQGFEYRIHEDIWERRNSAVLNRLGTLCGKNLRVHGRQCSMVRIDKLTAQAFLEQHHIGGYVTAYYKYGLFFNGRLLAVAPFSKGRTLHREDGRKSYELLRFATAAGYSIAGGLARLIRHFSLETSAKHLMTYADKEWTDGTIYLKTGFRLKGVTLPISFLIEPHSKNRIPFSAADDTQAVSWDVVKNRGNLKMVMETL